jgi:signal transduction histidine kinase
LDRIKIEQVFLNLCMNAIESMPEGGTLLLKTRSQPLETGGTEVIAEVEDTGPGIPDGNLPKVFDPFFTKKQMGKGTGLGLSVAKQIIELHGGTIKIGNRPEGGARVTITLQPQTGE